ncbi:hypothetical protein L211DRAFT_433042 [Terfezia boudieri ATCC MYA-4762]|uniref:Uncharacterized protein n=1 Tax=Terfezia boudieri ATCC MYA-4762 TaxID=1051890 RepID=A0A3N4LJ07_9PEZI|nr:hypothetical protein L211DRAFT_433042 [Terfezia boudieri ATCC MYA-4762]
MRPPRSCSAKRHAPPVHSPQPPEYYAIHTVGRYRTAAHSVKYSTDTTTVHQSKQL